MKILQINRNLLLSILVSISFLVIALFTLKDYGINWDAASHLSRGQAFLHYYLTGDKDLTRVENWNLYTKKEKDVQAKTANNEAPRHRLYFQNPDTILFSPDIPRSELPRISIFQYPDEIFRNIERYDFGHPHISDVLASVFNRILYQKLGVLNDIDSYRIYGVLLASLLVGLVFWWTAKLYGRFAGVVAALSLSVYPLFWAESHFNNEKDIPETVFWSFMLFSAWKGVTTKSWKWLLASGLFFGLALGTKFNILFSVFVITPWLVVYLASKSPKNLSIRTFLKKNIKIVIAAIVAPIFGISIFP